MLRARTLAGAGCVVWVLGPLGSASVSAAQAAADPPSRGAPALQRAMVRPFSLVDQHGRAVTDRDLRGRYALLFFGYTYCPDVCPTDLSVISMAVTALGPDAQSVQPVFITIDPERDTPVVLEQYLRHFHPRLLGLTGSPKEVAALAKGFGARYFKLYLPPGFGADDEDERDQHRRQSEEGYLMNHSAATYLVGPDGRLRAKFPHAADPGAMASRIRAELDRGRRR